MRTRFFRILAILVSAAAAAVFLQRSLPHLAGAGSRFSLPATLGISFIVIALQLVNALKLRLLLPVPTSMQRLYAICLISNFFGALLSTQIAGDLSKLWILHRSRSAPGGHPLAVVRDRLSSLVAVGLVLLWGLAANALSSSPANWPLHGLALLLSLLLCAWLTPRTERIVTSLANRISRACGMRWRAPELPPRAETPRWTLVHACSLAIQLAGLATIAYSFGTLGTRPGLFQTVMLSSISVAAVILPLSVGGLGVREVSSYSLLLHWGYPAPIAAAAVAHLTAGYLTGTALGGLLGWALLARRSPGPQLAPESSITLPLA